MVSFQMALLLRIYLHDNICPRGYWVLCMFTERITINSTLSHRNYCMVRYFSDDFFFFF